MLHIKELLLKQINEYDKRAGECCQNIVTARLSNEAESDDDHARMITCIAARSALRHFGEVSALR